MIELRKYNASHIVDLGITDPARVSYYKMAEASEFAVSGFVGGQCIGVCGIAWLYEKVYTLWANFGDGVRRRPIEFHREAKRYLPLWLDHIDWRRVEALVDPDQSSHCRWIKSLGFDFESRKWRGGFEGRDMLVFTRIR